MYILRRCCVCIYESSVLFARNPVMEYIRLCARRIIRLLVRDGVVEMHFAGTEKIYVFRTLDNM